MNDLMPHTMTSTAIRPTGRLGKDFHIREATEADLPWIDAMQKQHGEQLGFLPMMALKGKLAKGEVLVAEGARSEERGAGQMSEANAGVGLAPHSSLPTPSSPLGYLIAADRYFRRDEVGYVTQLCVVPQARRSLVAGALLQAQFDRSAYGCRLYSCWCAQDLEANRFWEAMGFVPIAFRTGSRKKRVMSEKLRSDEFQNSESGTHHSSTHHSSLSTSPRIHLFWQKKIRGEDDPVSYWYPAKTGGGAMMADRLVFPIPPGTHWRDVLPIVLPEVEDKQEDASDVSCQDLQIVSDERVESSEVAEEHGLKSVARVVYPDGVEERDGFLWQDGKRLMTREMILTEQHAQPGGMWFIPADATMVPALPVAKVVKPKRKRKKAKPVERPIDPRVEAMARELRDRWMEHEATQPMLPKPRHDVRRVALPEAAAAEPLKLAA